MKVRFLPRALFFVQCRGPIPPTAVVKNYSKPGKAEATAHVRANGEHEPAVCAGPARFVILARKWPQGPKEQ
jgi:hypothetical protein